MIVVWVQLDRNYNLISADMVVVMSSWTNANIGIIGGESTDRFFSIKEDTLFCKQLADSLAKSR